MKLLIKAASNQVDSTWGRFLVVTLDDAAMKTIQRRVEKFNVEQHTDTDLVEAAYQTEIDAYDSDVFDNSDDIDIEDLFGDEERYVLTDTEFDEISEHKTCDVGYTCMLIGAAGIAWEAGASEGPEETQTFPVTIEELEAIYFIKQ